MPLYSARIVYEWNKLREDAAVNAAIIKEFKEFYRRKEG